MGEAGWRGEEVEGGGGRAEAGSDPTRGVGAVDEKKRKKEKTAGNAQEARDTEFLFACLCFVLLAGASV